MTAEHPPYLPIAIAALVGAVAVATLPPAAPGWVLAGCTGGLLLAGLLTPPGHLAVVLRRGLLVGPFLVFLAAVELVRPEAGTSIRVAGVAFPLGLVRAVDILLKTAAAVSICLAWGERVGTHGIARTLHRARAPAAAVTVTFLAVNFLATLMREWEGVRLAARARGLNRARYAFRLRQLGASLLSVLVRSMWRGERVALAMRARGYTGRLPPPLAAAQRLAGFHAGLLVLAGALTATALLARMAP
ncbi:MAG: hypothetical protein JXQ29_09025 [Planctomycetes bacterium]|nr:hypothetical protein [Planctomycetota bacterium]